MNPVTVSMLRAEADEHPELTERQREYVRALSDDQVRDALDAAFEGYKQMWWTILDGTRSDALFELLPEEYDIDPPLAVGSTIYGRPVEAVSTCQHCKHRIGWVWDIELDDNDQHVPSTKYGWWVSGVHESEVCPGESGTHRPEGATEDNAAPVVTA